MDDNGDDRDEFTGRKRFNRQRADLTKLTPHEIKPMNRVVAGGIIVGSIAVGVAGWYVTKHFSEKSERPEKSEAQPKDPVIKRAPEGDTQ